MPQWLAVSLFVVAALVVLAALSAADVPRRSPTGRAAERWPHGRRQRVTLAVFVASVLVIVSLAAPYPSGMFAAVAIGAVAAWVALRTVRRS